MYKLLVVGLGMGLLGCSGGSADGYQVFWQAVLANTLELVVLFATPVVLLLARKALILLETKLDVTIDDKYSSQVEHWITLGIAYAHEQGRKALKAGEPPLSSDAKKIAAVEFVVEALDRSGLPEVGRDSLAKYVEACLNLDRAYSDTEKPE